MKPPATPREYVSVSEAASIAGVHRTTVWKWIDAGAIDSFETPKGQTRVRRKDIVVPRRKKPA